MVTKNKNPYLELKMRQQKEFNEFPQMSAFNEKQFKEGKQILGVQHDSELIALGAGCFIRKTDADDFFAMLKKQKNERSKAQNNENYLYEMFFYELANHEYCITYDLADTLNACGITVNDLSVNKLMQKMLVKATKDYLKSCE